MNASTGFYGVLDGVTPLHDFRDEAGHNGAYLASNLFKHELEHADGDASLKDTILQANRLLSKRMLERGMDLSIKHELWATCVAAVKLADGRLDYAQLGDSMVIAVYKDDSIRVLTENRVRGISDRAKVQREEERRQRKDLPDESYFDIPRHRMIYHRYLANTPNGYGVANGMEEAELYVQSGSLEIADLKLVLTLTDGLFYPGQDLAYTVNRIVQEGFEPYADAVYQAEQERGLAPDDRTGIMLQF